MAVQKGTLRTCGKGHKYYKSSGCPVCPVCEQQRDVDGFLATLSAPARRALENKGITTVQQLATFTQKEIMALHGIGPASLPVLRAALKQEQLDFKK